MRVKTIQIALMLLALALASTRVAGQEQTLSVTASFSNQQSVRSDEQIELQLNRELKESAERVAVLIGTTDVTSLFARKGLHLRYDAKLWPLPAGESFLMVYVVSPENDWKEVARFALRVAEVKNSGLPEQSEEDRDESDLAPGFLKTSYSRQFNPGIDTVATASDERTASQQQSTAPPDANPSANKKRRLTFIPSLTLGLPSQPAQSTFPGPKPDRATFIELNMQASLKTEANHGIFSAQSSFDFAGSSFEQEALRHGTDGDAAPKIDLSSYLVQVQTGKVKYQMGHFSYGTQRQLINGFSSRGLQISVPLSKRFDFSVAAMNGTDLVGYGNFFGLNTRKHQMLSGTLGVEFIPNRPGGLRLEVGLLNAYFQPTSGVNRGVITDLQRSRGFAVRLIFNDKSGRFHFEGGFTRSLFSSPSDPSLNQGANVVALPDLTRNAHFLEASYEILKNFSLSKTKKVNLSVAFREENVAPLFRSLGASTQADKIQYEFSVNGSINEITAQFSQSNYHDNLRRIPSILRSLTGNTHFSLAAPAAALLNSTNTSAWLPRLGYSFDRVHQYAAAIPLNGGFDPSTVPNLAGTNQTFTADWQVKKFNWGYNVNRSYQDNRQAGRELADQAVLIHSGRVGIAVSTRMNLNLDLSRESSADKETGRIDRAYRLGPSVTWQLTKHMGLTASLANTVAGDAAKTSHSRNTGFDASWTYRFERGKEGFKKLSGQFFLRYANQYSHSIERIFLSDNLGKNQTLTANLSITFF